MLIANTTNWDGIGKAHDAVGWEPGIKVDESPFTRRGAWVMQAAPGLFHTAANWPPLALHGDEDMSELTILDMCCGSRMFWFDKQDKRAVFSDIRAEEHTLCDGRHLVISPDVIADFRALPFAENTFPVVVFDPPHLERVGDDARMGKKYGRLNKDSWRDDLRAGFAEAFRVLRPHGVLIFKWNETQIPVSQILALTDVKPIIGQRTGKNDKTHWIIFVKD